MTRLAKASTVSRSGALAATLIPTAAGPVVLSAQAVSKRFGSVHAVADATVELPAGALGAVVGRSGSGKSTLLAILAGWQSLDAGTVTPDPRGLGWRRLAYLPQRFGLMPELTVRGNVELPLRIAGATDR